MQEHLLAQTLLALVLLQEWKTKSCEGNQETCDDMIEWETFISEEVVSKVGTYQEDISIIC